VKVHKELKDRQKLFTEKFFTNVEKWEFSAFIVVSKVSLVHFLNFFSVKTIFLEQNHIWVTEWALGRHRVHFLKH
jgi:hypothetical protein